MFFFINFGYIWVLEIVYGRVSKANLSLLKGEVLWFRFTFVSCFLLSLFLVLQVTRAHGDTASLKTVADR